MLHFTQTTAFSTAVLEASARLDPANAPALEAEADVGMRWLLAAHPFPDVFVAQVGDERDHDLGFRDPADDDGGEPAGHRARGSPTRSTRADRRRPRRQGRGGAGDGLPAHRRSGAARRRAASGTRRASSRRARRRRWSRPATPSYAGELLPRDPLAGLDGDRRARALPRDRRDQPTSTSSPPSSPTANRSPTGPSASSRASPSSAPPTPAARSVVRRSRPGRRSICSCELLRENGEIAVFQARTNAFGMPGFFSLGNDRAERRHRRARRAGGRDPRRRVARVRGRRRRPRLPARPQPVRAQLRRRLRAEGRTQPAPLGLGLRQGPARRAPSSAAPRRCRRSATRASRPRARSTAPSPPTRTRAATTSHPSRRSTTPWRRSSCSPRCARIAENKAPQQRRERARSRVASKRWPIASPTRPAPTSSSTRTTPSTGIRGATRRSQRARELDRPILLSIGYSACHWCHVMERESFENDEIAAADERALRLHQGRSRGATRRRRDLHGGGAGDDRPRRLAADRLLRPRGRAVLHRHLLPARAAPGDAELSDGARGRHPVVGSAARADPRRGRADSQPARGRRPDRARLRADLPPACSTPPSSSFARPPTCATAASASAPKFPPASALEFLLARGETEVVELTLDRWPPAASTTRSAAASPATRSTRSGSSPTSRRCSTTTPCSPAPTCTATRRSATSAGAQTAERTLDWMLAEMRGDEGGFYSALDADSEGVEGKFYVWTPAEIRRGSRRPRPTPSSTTTASPRRQLRGREHPPPGAAASTPSRPRASTRHARALYEVRSKRVWPGLDDKRLLSWNALAIAALADAGAVLGRDDYLDAARACAEFVWDSMRDADGNLLRTWKDGEAKLNAYLEDHAFLRRGAARALRVDASSSAGSTRRARPPTG